MGNCIAFGSLLQEGVPDSDGGPGRAARHVCAEARGVPRPLQRRRVDAAAVPVSRPGPPAHLRLAAERVRVPWLRVRLLGRAARCPRGVGGPVRRLRQRRADGHGRVHLVGRAEVGPVIVRRDASAARLRGAGPRPLVRPRRAIHADGGRGQHRRGDALDPRVVLPSVAAPGLQPAAKASRRLHAQVDAAPQGRVERRRGLHDGHVSKRSSPTGRSSARGSRE